MTLLQPAVSTGALAAGDVRRALDVVRSLPAAASAPAVGVELSALHEDELPQVEAAVAGGWASGLGRLSVHGPAKGRRLPEPELVERLAAVGLPTVMHPDVFADPAAWSSLGAALLVENTDDRKAFGQRPGDLDQVFAACPRAGFCLDVSHALTVGGRALVRELADRYRDRLAQLHVGCPSGRPVGRQLTAAELAAVGVAISLAERPLPVVLERTLSGPDAVAELGSALATLRSIV